jgi:hypothetical protein
MKDWTAADDERLRELSFNGVDARAIGIELKRTATAVRSRAFRMNLQERRPVVSKIGAWEKRKLSLKAKGTRPAYQQPRPAACRRVPNQP